MMSISTDTGKKLSFVREIRYPDKEKVRRLNNVVAHPRSRCWMVTIPAKYVNRDPSVLIDVAKQHPGWSFIGQMEEGTGKRFESNEGNRPKAPEGTVDPKGNPVQWLYGTGGLYQGLQHYHFCFYTPQMRMGAFAKLFPTQAHIDNVQRGKEAVARYCSKLDTRIAGPWQSEGFSFDGQGKRTDLKPRDDAVRQVLAGADPDELMRKEPKLLAFAKDFDRAYEIWMKGEGKKLRDVHTLYVYGEAGVGKSLWAWLYGTRRGRDVYRLTDYAHPWDDYRGESVVVIEDFDGRMRLDDVLRWTDRYPTQLTARYANKMALYDTVIFTSNRQMSGWYGSDDFVPKQGPLNRRITTVCASLGSDGDTVSFRHVAGPGWVEALPEESLRAMIAESNGAAPSGADGRGYVEKPEPAPVEASQPVVDDETRLVDMSSPKALPFVDPA